MTCEGENGRRSRQIDTNRGQDETGPPVHASTARVPVGKTTETHVCLTAFGRLAREVLATRVVGEEPPHVVEVRLVRLGEPPQSHRAVLGLASAAADDTQTYADDDDEGDGDGDDDGNDDFADAARLHVVEVTDEEHKTADVHLSHKTRCWARTKHTA